MPTKLRNLKITKVDFVDNGANPDAHITLYKRRDPTEKEGQMDMSVFERIGKSIMKALGVDDPEDIEKLAASFGEEKTKSRVRRVFDHVWWDYQDALRRSIESILSDTQMSDQDKADMIKQSLAEFTTAMTKALTDASAQMAIENAITKSADDPRLEIMKSMRDELDDLIEKAESGDDEEDPEDDPDEDDDQDDEDPDDGEEDETKEGDQDMKIDKSKMTEGEKALLEDFEKRYGAQETPPETPPAEDVNKGIHPEVAAELASLKKFKEDAELREMTSVAKKYELIGKKAEELAPKLLEMKKSGSYEDYIAVLDEQVNLVEKSGMFSEIGKRGSSGGDMDPWTQIEKKAEEIRKAEPTVGYFEAIDKACAQNPDLVEQYEKSRK